MELRFSFLCFWQNKQALESSGQGKNGCWQRSLDSKLFIKPLGFCNELSEGGWRRSSRGKVKSMHPLDKDYLAMDKIPPLVPHWWPVFLVGSVVRGDIVTLTLVCGTKFAFQVQKQRDPLLLPPYFADWWGFYFQPILKGFAPLIGKQYICLSNAGIY